MGRVTPRTSSPRALLLAVACGFALTGCLVPMPIEEQPVVVNYPPYFFSGQVSPETTRILDYDPQLDGPFIELRVAPIDDPNEDDRLFWRLFLNYNGQRWTGEAGGANGIGPEQRDRGVVVPLNPCAQFDGIAEDVNRIELLVADRPFAAADSGDPTQPFRHQSLPPDAGHFRLMWFLRFATPCEQLP